METIENIDEKSAEELKKIILSQQSNLQQKDQLIHQLYEQLKLARHHRFGSKSEKLNDEDNPQQPLFNEATPTEDKQAIETADEDITVASFRRKKGRKPFCQR